MHNGDEAAFRSVLTDAGFDVFDNHTTEPKPGVMPEPDETFTNLVLLDCDDPQRAEPQCDGAYRTAERSERTLGCKVLLYVHWRTDHDGSVHDVRGTHSACWYVIGGVGRLTEFAFP